MWFFLGVVALTLAVVYYYNLNIGHSNRYSSFNNFVLDKKFYKASYNSRTPSLSLQFFSDKHTLEVAVETNTVLAFTLTPERNFDRWAKRLRLSIEPQTGNDKIDSAFYLDCRNDFTAKQLDSPTLEHKFTSLLEKQFLDSYVAKKGSIGKLIKSSMSLMEIRSTGKFLSVKFKCSEPIEDILPPQKSLASICYEISEILNQQRDKSGYLWWKDKSHYKSAFLLSISSALGLMGFFEYFRLYLSLTDTTTILNYTNIYLA